MGHAVRSNTAGRGWEGGQSSAGYQLLFTFQCDDPKMPLLDNFNIMNLKVPKHEIFDGVFFAYIKPN